MTDRVALGKIGRPHGVRGEVRLFLYNPHSETLEAGLDVYLASPQGEPVQARLEQVRYTPKFLIVKIEGLNHRDEVDRFKHGEILVDFDQLPELDDEEFYHTDLLNLPVYLASEEDGDVDADQATPIGVVDRLFETGANEVVVVRRSNGEELMVPLVEHALSIIDLERELIVLQPLKIWAPS